MGKDCYYELKPLILGSSVGELVEHEILVSGKGLALNCNVIQHDMTNV